MKYVALLRGINVGGNTMIKMADLKLAFEKQDFTNVKTYINSGNVVFESNEKNITKITDVIEKMLFQTFKYAIRVVVLSDKKLQAVIEKVPAIWRNTDDLRCYIAFVKLPTTPKQVLQKVELKEGIDMVDEGPGVLYMSTKLEGLTKSKLNKIAAKKIYQQMTIRNYTTTQKLLALMEK